VTAKAPLSVVAALAISFAALTGPGKPKPSADLPQLGTLIEPLPEGPAKGVADQACLNCHSGDVLRQQRLTEKQWTANVTKMIGWGAEVPEDRREELVLYLAKNFGPGNVAFRPVAVRPIRVNR
jgi:hypothetical protein